jgi:serine/threonine protein kinase
MKIKKLGKGAYGKVMQVIHKQTEKSYACKRFE